MEEIEFNAGAKMPCFGAFFEALHEFYSLQCRGVRNSAGVAMIF